MCGGGSGQRAEVGGLFPGGWDRGGLCEGTAWRSQSCGPSKHPVRRLGKGVDLGQAGEDPPLPPHSAASPSLLWGVERVAAPTFRAVRGSGY